MKKIVIIGGGIVGSTAAFYLSQMDGFEVTLIDDGTGNATRAAAGIICPWLSQRRNKNWYNLTSQGACFYPKLMHDLSQTGSEMPYKQTGTLVFKKKDTLLETLYTLATERRSSAPMIDQLSLWSSESVSQLIPQLKTEQGAVLTSGGGRVDGGQLLDSLLECFQQNGGKRVKGIAQITEKHMVSVEQVGEYPFDHLILSAGAWLPQLLSPLGYNVDVRPQKGQLLEVQTDFQTDDWPGCMLHHEIDILPFPDGKLVIGASHEDDMGYDLTVDSQKIANMKTTAQEFVPALSDYPIHQTRVGTRAYTSDYSPFYGNIAEHPHIWVASGLGSSGLTSGPFIGWQIAQEIAGKPTEFDRSPYTPTAYITKKTDKTGTA